MNIMHVSLGLPPYRTGGLTKYSVDLMLEQKRTHQVSLLYPGSFMMGRGTHIKKNDPFQGIEVFEIINPMPVPLLGGIKEPTWFMKSGSKQAYEKLLDVVVPDLIHVHTLMGLHKEFLEVAKTRKIKVIYTTHDYFGICPKVNLIDNHGNICLDYGDGDKCAACNQAGYSMLKIAIMQSRTYRNLKDSSIVKKIRKHEKNKTNQPAEPEQHKEQEALSTVNQESAQQYVQLRENYLSMLRMIDVFHYNSSISKREFEKYVHPSGEILSITHSDIRDQRIRKVYDPQKPLQIAYLGPVDRYKGFYLLKQALQELGDVNWHLHAYGDSSQSGIGYDSAHFTFHGKYKHSDLGRIFERTDLLIVPSIWKETFGFIGLEALSHGVPTLISEHVGFKDLIQDGETGIIFKAEKSELRKHLLALLKNRDILDAINKNILSMNFNYTMENHAKQLNVLYKAGE